jgi:hypothetical protein
MSDFSLPQGWVLERSGEISTITGPEGDVRITFVELEPQPSIQETALAAWKMLDPSFSSKVMR